jgi:phosphonate transport system substrate-binding protein
MITFFTTPCFTQAKQEDSSHLTIGYSIKSLPDLDIKDVTAALDLWVKELSNEVGFTAESLIYRDMNLFREDLKSGKVDMGIAQTVDFFSLEKETKITPAIAKIKEGKLTDKYLLLVHKDSDCSSIKDLKKKKLAILANTDFGLLFLNNLLVSNNLPKVHNFFSVIEEKKKPSQVILPVFFKQMEACITTEKSFKLMAELNPQVGAKLKVLASSPEIIETVSFFRKDYKDTLKQEIIKHSKNLKNYVRGEQILLLFQVDELVEISGNDLTNTRRLFNKYK